METLFRRHFWIFHVVLLAVVAFLAARSINALLGHAIQSSLREGGLKTVAQKPVLERGRVRDFEKAGEQNIFGAKREQVTEEKVDANTCSSHQDCERDEVCEEGRCVKTDSPVGEMADAVPSELRARLVGTAVFSDPDHSLASIVDESQGRNAEARLYSIHDCPEDPKPPPVAEGEDPPPTPPKPPCNDLMGVATIKAIEPTRVYLYNREERRWEYLQLGEKPEKGPQVASAQRVKKPRASRRAGSSSAVDEIAEGIHKVSESRYEVQQSAVDQALSNLAGLATQARIVPAFEGGEPVGFKLFSIRPGSLYSKIGIQNGDVISRINGYEINSPDKALEVYQKLKDSKSISVDLKRRGKPITLEYQIVP